MAAKSEKVRKAIKLARKGRPARQVAALPYRITDAGTLEVLLLTSRTTKRFVVPKGWPIKGLHPSAAAAREAYEEAGVRGKVGKAKIGSYRYWKRLPEAFVLIRVDVYPLLVERQTTQWQEAGERTAAWLLPEDAMLLVDDPEMVKVIEKYSKRMRAKLKAGARKVARKRDGGGKLSKSSG
jgi:8-oxo-dGTP pyrophosphatase MutT (NUDIX family)